MTDILTSASHDLTHIIHIFKRPEALNRVVSNLTPKNRIRRSYWPYQSFVGSYCFGKVICKNCMAWPTLWVGHPSYWYHQFFYRFRLPTCVLMSRCNICKYFSRVILSWITRPKHVLSQFQPTNSKQIQNLWELCKLGKIDADCL